MPNVLTAQFARNKPDMLPTHLFRRHLIFDTETSYIRLPEDWWMPYQRPWPPPAFHCFVGYINMAAVKSLSACAPLLTDLPKCRWVRVYTFSTLAAVSSIPRPYQLPHRLRKTYHEDQWSLRWRQILRLTPPRPIGLRNSSEKINISSRDI